MDRALESSLSTKQNVVGVLCADSNGLLISGENSVRFLFPMERGGGLRGVVLLCWIRYTSYGCIMSSCGTCSFRV